MANRAKHPCRYVGCTALVGQGAYCELHRGERDRVTDAQRPSAARRGYDATWRRLRLVKLAMNPLCEECLLHGQTVAAREVDHIMPLADGGTNEVVNLRSLCKPCHSRKTAAQSNGRGRGGKSLGPGAGRPSGWSRAHTREMK